MIVGADTPPASFDWDDYSWDESTGAATFSRWNSDKHDFVKFVVVHRRWWLSKEERAALRY